VSIIELRQYTLVPGKREALIDLFEAQLIEPQEERGARIIGTFRDLDDESRFVWLRGFPDMESRAHGLQGFYGGAAWRRHRDAANATMIDSDNVLLLRPAWEQSAFATDGTRPAPGVSDSRERGIVEAAILNFRDPTDSVDLMYFCDEVAPLIEEAGGLVLACLVTEPAENNFPALPVREGENVLVWFAGFPHGASKANLGDEVRAKIIDVAGRWPGVAEEPQILKLEPTRRSRLTGASGSQFKRAHILR
jgi:hypothetical protein